MKIRESGMPDEEVWETFFDVEGALSLLGCDSSCRNVVDFGCGYGHFTVAAARVASGMVVGLDLEPEMVDRTWDRAQSEGLTNVVPIQRDMQGSGTGLPDEFGDFAMLLNILHAEQPVTLLCEAFRILTSGGRLGIMHWRCDVKTPRGPSMDIRPSPEQCADWAAEAGFLVRDVELPCCPFHYGLVCTKP